MLIGSYKHSVDKKGRVFMPVKLRESLGDELVISKSIDGEKCVCVYPKQEWEKFMEKLSQLPSADILDYLRYISSGAFPIEFDSQGRILISQELKTLIGIEDATSVTVIGAINRVEIWNDDAWDEKCRCISKDTLKETLRRCGI